MEHTGKANKIVVLGDVHIPYQDNDAIKLVLMFIKWYKPQVLIMNGDIVDATRLSKYRKEPDTKRFSEEIDLARSFLNDIKMATGRWCVSYFIFGNHELRCQKYLIDNAPELYEVFSLEDLLQLTSRFIIVNESMKENYLHIGNWYVGHWNKVNKHSGYTAKNLIDDRGVNIVQGHTHRLAIVQRRFIDRLITGVEGGCLCTLTPDYVVKPNWSTGFVVIDYGVAQLAHIQGQLLYFGRKRLAIRG